MRNLKHFFGELHKALEEREAKIQLIYEEYCKQFKVEYVSDIQKLAKIQEQLNKIFRRIDAMSHGFEKANEVAVVGSVDKVKEIGKNYGLFNSRLQKMYPPSSFTIRQKDELPKIPTFSINMSNAKRYIDSLGSVHGDFGSYNLGMMTAEGGGDPKKTGTALSGMKRSLVGGMQGSDNLPLINETTPG